MSAVSRFGRPAHLPVLGPVVPATTLHVAAAAVGAGLLVALLPPSYRWLAAPMALALAVLPGPLTSGAVVLVLAWDQLLQPLVPVRPGFFLLLAGAHLLHVLTGLAAAVPRRGWLQLAALRRPVVRFVGVQLPVQAAAVVVLALVPGRTGGLAGLWSPAGGAVGAVALVALALLLVRPLLRRPRG